MNGSGSLPSDDGPSNGTLVENGNDTIASYSNTFVFYVFVRQEKNKNKRHRYGTTAKLMSAKQRVRSKRVVVVAYSRLRVSSTSVVAYSILPSGPAPGLAEAKLLLILPFFFRSLTRNSKVDA